MRTQNCITAAAFAISISAFSEGTARAADWYVPGDSPTVSGALSMAASGDRVYVGPGTYNEHITVPAGVRLYGSGPEVSILDGSASGTVVKVGGNGVVISGFSIRNAGKSYPSFGVDVTNAAATICGNMIYWNFRGVWVEGPSDTNVLWNVSVDNEDDGLDGVNAKASFRGNTVVSNGNPAIMDGDIGIYLMSVDVRVISENIVVYDNEYGIWCDGLTESNHNDVFGHQSDFTSCGSNPTDFSADPQFVAWSDDNDPRNDDFHLKPSSPCVDVIPAAPFDADGSARDIGAYGGQGYDGGPRPTWALSAEVDTVSVTPDTTASIKLVAWPQMIPCDHGVDELELTLPGFLSGLAVSGVEVDGSPVNYQLSGNGPVVVKLDSVISQPSTIAVKLDGQIPAGAAGSETIGVRAGMAFINAWRQGKAGDGDNGAAVDTMSLTITAAGGGAGGAGSGGSAGMGGGTSSGTGGSSSSAGGSGSGTGGAGGSGNGAGGSSAGEGGGTGGGDPQDTGSCGCRLAGLNGAESAAGLGAFGLLGLLAMRRRRGLRG